VTPERFVRSVVFTESALAQVHHCQAPERLPLRHCAAAAVVWSAASWLPAWCKWFMPCTRRCTCCVTSAQRKGRGDEKSGTYVRSNAHQVTVLPPRCRRTTRFP